jgi:hypothetical protein
MHCEERTKGRHQLFRSEGNFGLCSHQPLGRRLDALSDLLRERAHIIVAKMERHQFFHDFPNWENIRRTRHQAANFQSRSAMYMPLPWKPTSRKQKNRPRNARPVFRKFDLWPETLRGG